MTELLTIPGNWNFDYRYFAGETASRFFAEVRPALQMLGIAESAVWRRK